MDINTAYNTLMKNPGMTADREGQERFMNFDPESESFFINDMAGGSEPYEPSVADLRATDWRCHA